MSELLGGQRAQANRPRWAILAPVLERLDRWSRRIMWAAIAFTIVVTGGYALHFRGQLRFSDESDYLAIVNNLAHGHGFSLDGQHPTAYRAPGWALLLAPFRLAGVPVTELRLVAVALVAVTVYLAWHLANDLGGRAAAALASAASAVYPVQVFTASTFYPETLATALLITGVLCVVRADRAREAAKARRLLIVAGLVFSCLFLTVPPFVVPGAIALGWYGWRHRALLRSTLPWVVIVALVPVTLWIARNEIQLGAFIPVTTNAGGTLLLGNSEHAVYNSADTDITAYQAVAQTRHLDEVAVNRYFESSALTWMRNHQGHAVVLWGEKTLYYFSATNHLHTGGESSPGRNLLAELTYYPLLALLVVRLLLARRFPLSAAEWLIVVAYVAMAPVFGIYFPRVRYRVPLDELLLVFLAVAASGIASAASGRLSAAKRRPSPEPTRATSAPAG